MRAAQALERRRVGRVALLGAARLRQPQLLEEELRELLRRTQVELVADRVIRLPRQLLNLLAEVDRHLAQRIAVDSDARLLHAHEHGDERDLDVVVEVREALFLQLRLDLRLQPARHVDISTRERRRLLRADFRDRDLLHALADEVAHRRDVDAKALGGQPIDVGRPVPKEVGA